MEAEISELNLEEKCSNNISKFRVVCVCVFIMLSIHSVQFSSVTQSCPTLCIDLNKLNIHI